MADDVLVFSKPDLPNMAFPVMEEIRRQAKLCDVTLKIGDQKFSAHRIVLAASIPYFHAMFTHDMVESRQDEITMQGIDAEALEAIINFAYNGRIQIDSTNVQSLLVGASFLHMQVVKDACCDFLKNRLHPKNVLGIKGFAEQFMCPVLVEAANRYIQHHFVTVSMSEEFMALSNQEVIDLVSQDELHVPSEEQVFECVMNWVKKDVENRKCAIGDLLSQVRLPLLTPEFLSDRIASESIIKTSFVCRDLLDEARDYHLMPERRTKIHAFKTRPRCCTDLFGIIYAVGGLTSSGDSLSTVECFSPVLGKWESAPPMNTLRSRVGVAVLNGCLYAVGGFDGNERLNTVEKFDPVTKIWSVVAPMNRKRSAVGCAALDGKLYVCGGYDGVSSLHTVEFYDTIENKWCEAASMVRQRSAAGLAVFDGQLYAIGGHDGLQIYATVECYNNLTNTWNESTPMLSKRCRLGVAALHGKLYVAGGYDGASFLNSVEYYDPFTNKWVYTAPMKTKRSRVALVANCGKLYAIGGYDGVRNLNTVERYDPEEDSWQFVAPMCAHEGGVGVGVIPLEPDP